MTRILILVLFLVPAVAFVSATRIEGLSGNRRISVTWQTGRRMADAEKLVSLDDPIVDRQSIVPDATEFPRFRASNSDGVVGADNTCIEWANEASLAWRKTVGFGWGSFAIAGTRAVTLEQRSSDECVVCYDTRDGRELWSHKDPTRFDSGLGGPGPRSTPTIDNGRVFSQGATGRLNCLTLEAGKLIWTVDVLEDNGCKNGEHGISASPLLVGDLVVTVSMSNASKSLVAYDVRSGKREWANGIGEASCSSPTFARICDEMQILLFNRDGLASHNVETGNVLWFFPWRNDNGTNCTQPVVHAGAKNHVYISTGYGKGCAYFRVENLPSEKWNCDVLWSNRNMKNKFSSSVVHDGRVYGLDDGILVCQDLASGDRLWKRGRFGHGQILLVGDQLLIQAENGDVVIVEASPTGLSETNRIRHAIDGKTWNSPALAGRRLIIRNDREAACYLFPMRNDSDMSR